MKRTMKGITLIALIITIVILLILAVVAINEVQGDGIIAHAKNATSDYEKAQNEEQEKLMQAEYEMAKASGKTQGTYNDYLLEKEYGVKIGEKVNYTATGTDYHGEWAILGEENGQLLIVSASNVNDNFGLSTRSEGWDSETMSYQGLVDKLNNECKKYGNGTGATGSRCVKLEDISKAIGNSAVDKEIHLQKETVTEEGWSLPDGRGLNDFSDEIITFKNRALKMNQIMCVDYMDGDGKWYLDSPYRSKNDFLVNKNIYDSIFPGENKAYWVAEIGSELNSFPGDEGRGEIYLGIQTVSGSKISFDGSKFANLMRIGCHTIWDTFAGNNQEGRYELTRGLRAVVSLEKGVKLTKDDNGVWQIQ